MNKLDADNVAYAKPPPRRSNLVGMTTGGMRARLILMAFLSMSVSIARGQVTASALDKAAVHSARMVMRDDAIIFATLHPSKALYDWSTVGIQPPSETISPETMRQAFRKNEIAAERRFSKPFIVRGKLDSVVRGRDNLIFVRFVGGGVSNPSTRKLLNEMSGGMYTGGAQASVPDQFADVLANWKLGQEIAVRCESAANSPTALLLDKCIPSEAVIANAEKVADRQSDLLLSRQFLEVNGRGGLLAKHRRMLEIRLPVSKQAIGDERENGQNA